MKGPSKAELLAQQEKLSKGFSPDLSAIEDNLSKLPEEMWEKQIAGFEKDNSQKTTEKSQQRTDEFNAKEEAKQVARQEKAAVQRDKTVTERQRIDADFKAYDKQYAQYRTEMENQLEQSYQNGINRGEAAYVKGRQTSAISGDFAAEYDWAEYSKVQSAMWQDGKARAQVVQQVKDVFVEVYNKGEVTIAFGATLGESAGAGANVATGKYISIDFGEANLIYGEYYAAEAQTKLGIPMPEANAGLELSIYPTSDPSRALNGGYNIYGGSFALGDVSVGLINTDRGNLKGLQVSLTKSTPSLANTLPNYAGFVVGGTGRHTEVFNIQEAIQDVRTLW